MKLHLHSIGQTLYDGQVEQIGLSAAGGDLTILPGHVPLVTLLKNGKIEVKIKNENKIFKIRGGLAQIHGDSAIILVD